MTTCGVCQKTVDRAEHKDAHSTKQCATCRQTRTIDNFPRHPSSGDGRRHICATCIASDEVGKKQARADRAVEERAARNARFRAHGYRWESTPIATGNSSWVLIDPKGLAVDPREADTRIAQIESDRAEIWNDDHQLPF